MDGSMNYCVSLISMHNIVNYQSNMTCLTVIIRNVHIPNVLYFIFLKKFAN